MLLLLKLLLHAASAGEMKVYLNCGLFNFEAQRKAVVILVNYICHHLCYQHFSNTWVDITSIYIP